MQNRMEMSYLAKEYVVEGAKLSCMFGSKTSKLQLPQGHGVRLQGKKRANIGDAVPVINILPFGICKISTVVCTPACAAWISGQPDVLVGKPGLPALLNTDKLFCMACGGIISIEESGQT